MDSPFIYLIMKKHLPVFLLLFGTVPSLLAQGAIHLAGAAQRQPSPIKFLPAESQTLSRAAQPARLPAHKNLQTVAPIQLASYSNAFTLVRPEQNQVAYDDALDICMHIHRQDVGLWGGGSSANGILRYDLSIDGGASFTTDIGPLQVNYNHPARYPNGIFENPTQSDNPFDARIIYFAPTLDGGNNWNGYVSGVTDVATTNPATSDFYWNGLGNPYLPGGLCEGLPGEYWIVDNTYAANGNHLLDTIRIMKGLWNHSTGEVDWSLHASPAMPFSLSFDGEVHAVSANIAFSPDGMHGWIGFLGDLYGGRDSIYQPIFLHSTDGGATWGNPIEVQLDNVAWIADSLLALWVDSLGNPVSSGHATTGFDCDLTVDVNGDVHLGVMIGTAYPADSAVPGYSIYSGLAKFLADVHSENGGLTFGVDYLAPVLTMRGEFGRPDIGETVLIDNHVQVSRNTSGGEVYFSWVDSDTNVIGFGVSLNMTPNLRILGKRIADDYKTCWKRITDGDLSWDGRVLFPSMAPTMNEEGTENYLPLVVLEMNGSPNEPCRGWYFGNDAAFHDSDFLPPGQISTSWDGACYDFFAGVLPAAEEENFSLGVFPNPAAGEVTFYVELKRSEEVTLSLVNQLGQEVQVLMSGPLAAGRHESTTDLSSLPAGIYFYTLTGAAAQHSGKLVIE